MSEIYTREYVIDYIRDWVDASSLIIEEATTFEGVVGLHRDVEGEFYEVFESTDPSLEDCVTIAKAETLEGVIGYFDRLIERETGQDMCSWLEERDNMEEEASPEEDTYQEDYDIYSDGDLTTGYGEGYKDAVAEYKTRKFFVRNFNRTEEIIERCPCDRPGAVAGFKALYIDNWDRGYDSAMHDWNQFKKFKDIKI